MRYELKYGTGHLCFTLPDSVEAHVFKPGELPVLPNVEDTLRNALNAPLDAPRFEDLPCPASVAIAVPDETRPTPLKKLLPVLLERLAKAWPGLARRDIYIVVGGGLHEAPDAAQLARILPPQAEGCTVVAHDAHKSEFVRFGTTSRGTPVEINAAYARAAYKIVIGQIDPHQFVGFTGGAKGVVIGCASKDMIEHSHGLMSDPLAHVGNVATNPVRQDLNEAGEMAGVNLAINVVLDADKNIVGLCVGRPVAALEAGWPISAQVYGLHIDSPCDLAVASCGGRPKDICLYQAQKGLNHASRSVREGGTLFLLAACEQGIGDEVYETYVSRFTDLHELMREFKAGGFRMGAHKAYLFGTTLSRYRVGVVSELDRETLGRCMLEKIDLQPAIDAWIRDWNQSRPPRVAIIPNANTAYFHIG